MCKMCVVLFIEIYLLYVDQKNKNIKNINKNLNIKNKIQKPIQKFKKHWTNMYKRGDIYFSPNLSKNNTGLSINI